MMKDVTGRIAEQAAQGVRPEGRRRPAPAAELSRGGPLGGLRADPERAEAGRRGDPGRGREPGPHDPQRRRPASGRGPSPRPRPTPPGSSARARPQATRIANDAHAADPAFYQFLKTLETYRAALDSQDDARPLGRQRLPAAPDPGRRPSRRRRRRPSPSPDGSRSEARRPAGEPRRRGSHEAPGCRRRSSSGCSPTWPPA